MVYNDSSYNNGHKDNILDEFHTPVSLGIAYDKYKFVVVQNFENQYLRPNYMFLKDKNEIKLQAKTIIQNRNNFTINHVSLFIDAPPTHMYYEKNKNKNNYHLGDLKLMVSKPLPSSMNYVQDLSSYKIIEAKKWNLIDNNLNVKIKIPDSLIANNKVLTMVVYGKSFENSGNEANSTKYEKIVDYIPLTSYTLF